MRRRDFFGPIAVLLLPGDCLSLPQPGFRRDYHLGPIAALQLSQVLGCLIETRTSLLPAGLGVVALLAGNCLVAK